MLESVYNRHMCEKETTISMVADCSTANVYTSDNAVISKLKKIWKKNPTHIECWEMGRDKSDRVTGYTFKMNRKYILIKNSMGREVSEENKKLCSERFKKMHADKKANRIEE